MQGQESDLVILVGPFQRRTFYDSSTISAVLQIFSMSIILSLYMDHLRVSLSPIITLSSSQPVLSPTSWDMQRDVVVKQRLFGSADT